MKKPAMISSPDTRPLLQLVLQFLQSGVTLKNDL